MKISPRDIKAVLKSEVRKDEIEELKRRLGNIKEVRNEMKKLWSLITATFDIGSCGGCGFAYMKPKFLDSWICPNW